MHKLFRWLLRIVSGLILLALAALAGAWWLASRSLPDYGASFTLAGLSAPVEIVRDSAAVPHIMARSDADALFALGFVHAQDRLWQMLMLRRSALGRMAELFGPASLPGDALMRRLDLGGAAEASLAALDERSRALLQAYAAGVNARLKVVNARALGRGAPELFVFNAPIRPWRASDSIAILKLLALQMTSQAAREVRAAEVSLILPPERVRDILPEAPGKGIAELPEFAALFPPKGRRFARAGGRFGPAAGTALPPPDLAGASGAWAAGPSRSASGAALLANDPHAILSAPSQWYLARLQLRSGGVIGATIPGIPAILAGRSDRLGWGFTTAYADDQDLFIEKLHPEDPRLVLTPEGYRPLIERRETIRVKGGGEEEIVVRRSENGPLLDPADFGVGAITPPGHAMALGWTGLSRQDTSIRFWLSLMRAGSIEEAIAAGADQVAPALNLVLAEPKRVAMKLVGRLPERSIANRAEGRLPVPGWIASSRWQGMLPYSGNPAFVDPQGGIVGNTNNKLVERPFPLHISHYWGDTQRVERWRKLMQSREVHTRESFMEAQLDIVSFTARSLLPLVGRDLWFTGEAAPEGSPERQRQKALKMLADWNGEMNEYMPEPLIYAAWMRALQDRLIRDELGPLADGFTHLEPVFIERVFRDADGASAWCDVIQSAPAESCTEIARLALDDALQWLAERYGPDLDALRWGEAHVAAMDHPVLGRVPLLRYLVNIRLPVSGGDNTLMRSLSAGTGANPFLNVHAAGYRGIYDFGDQDASLFVISTGQSGHPLSPYYDNLSELWQRGEYLTMSLDTDLARAASVGITHLEPAPSE